MVSSSKMAFDRISYVLVVDDDSTLLKFFKIHLNKFFSHVLVVKNAKEAIETLSKQVVDLVISDIKMPRTTGVQLAKKVKTEFPSIPFLLITGMPLTDTQILEYSEVSDGLLRKPFAVDELHKVIENGLKKRDLLRKLEEIIQDKKILFDLVSKKPTMELLKKFVKSNETLNNIKKNYEDYLDLAKAG